VTPVLQSDRPIPVEAPRRRSRRSPVTAINRKKAPDHALKLSEFIPAADILSVRGSLDRAVNGVTLDSRRVVPGVLFFALKGLRTDGAGYIDEAANRGAAAIVMSRIPTSTPSKVTFIEVADPRRTLARASRAFYGKPDKSIEVVGITGTNGKTTVAHLVRHFLQAGGRTGLIGTVSYDLGARTLPSFKTTPEAPDLYSMLAQMRESGCRAAVMEVSSHGIDQHRVLGLEFAAAVFTNLTRDHLDYHGTLDDYFDVKARLFGGLEGPPPRVAVINLDDPRGSEMAKRVSKGVRLVTFGEAAEATVRASEVELGFKGTKFTLHWPGGNLPVESAFVGRYNVSNLLAAIATAWGLGRDPAEFLPLLKSFPGVPGRMERVEAGQPFNVLVDYAHTDDALRNALGMLRAVTPGRLLVVFGCGGNRDRTKRPRMVQAVQEHADLAFATADNPRTEPLERIFEDMRAGVTAPDKIVWVEDRRRAIGRALDAVKAGDCLLIAGKGHESYQEFADRVVPFDDRQVVRELIGIKALKS